MPAFSSTLASVSPPRLGQARPPAPGRGKYPTPLRVCVAAAPEPETRVNGYVVGELLARGGMSTIFAVTHPDRRQPLAMKVITDRRLQDDLAFEAIHAHAKTSSLLKSPHVVHTIDAGRLPSGEPFIVMEKLEGEDLGQRLAREGALPVLEAIHAVAQACEGLAEAHAAGIVHGDIKPGNLVLTTDPFGSPCLAIVDFTPAVPSAKDPDDPLVTFSPGYAAPEQLVQKGVLDGRADVWALGAVLHELVTGERAFAGSSLTAIMTAMRKMPPALHSRFGAVPEGLDAVVQRCLAHDREGRFASVLELRAALVQVERELSRNAEVRQRAAVTARNRVVPAPEVASAHNGRLRRTMFLAALGPASAVISMTVVRIVLAILH